MTNKELKYREINDDFTQMTCVFYEHMRPGKKNYSKNDVNECITKLIKSLTEFRRMK